jgi:Domain of unknown function (DUF4157)
VSKPTHSRDRDAKEVARFPRKSRSQPGEASGKASANNQILRLQRTIGNQAVQRLLQPDAPSSDAEPGAREIGQSVPEQQRAQFEQATGKSVGPVRVHTGPDSRQAADAFQAQAFTIGNEIHFAAGRFEPGTHEGDGLLAHELTHTVQQRAAAPTPQMQLEISRPSDQAELEAEAVADTIAGNAAAEVPIIQARPSGISLQPKNKPAKTAPKKATKPAAPAQTAKPAKPKPITFNLFSARFSASVDAANNVSVTAAGNKTDGWMFTAAGPNTVKAERTLDHAEYVHAGGKSDPLVERCTITVPAGGPATHTPIVAELGDPPTLSIALGAPKKAAKTKSVVVNGVTVEQLDLPAGAIAFTPADGDAIHIALGGDAWVFTTLKPDPVGAAKTAADIKGFFHVGYFTKYQDKSNPLAFGIATPSMSDAARKQAMDDLATATTPAGRRITTDEAEMFKTVSLIESGFAGVQTYDTGILSFGFAQWTVNADLPRVLLKMDATTFEKYLGRYGLSVGSPVRQLDAFVHKFVGSHRNKLGVRNSTEGALFLNGQELVNKRLLAMATTQMTLLSGFARDAAAAKLKIDTAKPDLTSKDAAKKAAAVQATAEAKKVLNNLDKAMTGLAGMKKEKDLSAQAANLAKVAADGAAAAKDLLANCADSEALRGEEWALRFEMLGQSPGGQDAEIAEVRANWKDVASKSTHGAAFTTLLPNLRGKAALLSSYLNTHGAADGVARAVDVFKKKKQKEAKAAAAAAAAAKKPAPSPTEADWIAFPWNAGDARWKTLWTTTEIEEFEAIAIIEVTKSTTDPKRRRGIIKVQFP